METFLLMRHRFKIKKLDTTGNLKYFIEMGVHIIIIQMKLNSF